MLRTATFDESELAVTIPGDKAEKVIEFLRTTLPQISDEQLREAIEQGNAQAAYDRLTELKKERLAGQMTGDHFQAPTLANAVRFMIE